MSYDNYKQQTNITMAKDKEGFWDYMKVYFATNKTPEEPQNECAYCGEPCENRYCDKNCKKAYENDN